MSIQVSDGVSKVIVQEGSGNCPRPGDKIKVQCTGSLNGNPPKKFWRLETIKMFSCLSLNALFLTVPKILDKSHLSSMWAWDKSSKVNDPVWCYK